jgi:hypothetical protein
MNPFPEPERGVNGWKTREPLTNLIHYDRRTAK